MDSRELTAPGIYMNQTITLRELLAPGYGDIDFLRIIQRALP